MSLEKELSNYGKVKTNLSFKDITTIRIGGPIKYVVSPFSIEDLRALMSFIKNNNLKYKILGKGSNLVCSDEEYDGVVIRLDEMDNCYFKGNQCVVEAGISAIRLAQLALNNSMSGLEFIGGIPGTIGGLIYMNAGAYKSSISDVIEEVFVLKGNEIEWLPTSECHFSYRNSIFKEHPDWIILGGTFNLTKGNKEEIKALMDDRFERRKNTQPLDKPSCGSCFKNPEGEFVWKLIDGCDLRGYRSGGIEISFKHPNFIVNVGNGTSKEFIEVTELIKKQIKEKYNIDLNLEVELFDGKN